MKAIFEKVKDHLLFRGIGLSDFDTMLHCVQGRLESYERDEILQLANDPVETVGLVITGTVRVVREDREGRQNLMAELGEGELFGEVFACAGVSRSPVTVLAAESCQILRIDYRRVIATCSSACAFHQRLIENMLTLVAQKNLMLHQKIEILSKRTTRERLLLFFDLHRQGKRRFTLPYNREELAAYLCVDRSAMSAELSRMQREGLIRYDRRRFELLEE